MIIFPAIDIKDGNCVRLFKGDFNTVEKVASDYLETAKSFEAAGDGMDKATNSMLADLKAMRNKAENELSGFDISGEISTGRYNSNIRKFTGGVNITQNIYSQAMTAADVMEEALYRQREAILFGV